MAEPTKTAPAPPEVDELKIALDNRAFEIQLFWQRSNYFLVLMSALGIGTFTIKDPVFSPIVALFAAGASFLWFRTNLGSKFWQESWEVEVVNLAREQHVRSFERPTQEIVEQVRSSLGSPRSFNPLRTWIYRQILTKPSVTYHMIILSLFSTLAWVGVFAILIIRLISGNHEEQSQSMIFNVWAQQFIRGR